MNTSFEFVKEAVTPQDKEALRSFSKQELKRRIALGVSQTLALVGEMVARSENDEAIISKLHTDLKSSESKRHKLETFNHKLGYREQNLKTELRKCQDALKEANEKIAKLEAEKFQMKQQLAVEQAKKTFFKGEGASQLVHRMFGSDEFGKFLGEIMTPAKNYGYHLALSHLDFKYPDLGIKNEDGYDEDCYADMDDKLDELKNGKIVLPIESFVPSSPEINWISEEEVDADPVNKPTRSEDSAQS